MRRIAPHPKVTGAALAGALLTALTALTGLAKHNPSLAAALTAIAAAMTGYVTPTVKPKVVRIPRRRKPAPSPPRPPLPPTHRFGIDFAWGSIPIRALKRAKVTFVVRYLSHDSSKNLHDEYADALAANGIDIVVIWETTADRASQGTQAGESDAREALAQATACGMPKGRPIYFAVDWDASGLQVAAYFRGVVRVLGSAATGVYAGYAPVSWLMDRGVVKFGWQTYAWSAGRWFSRAQLFQYSNGHRVGGVEVDYDHSAAASDFGQWRA